MTEPARWPKPQLVVHRDPEISPPSPDDTEPTEATEAEPSRGRHAAAAVGDAATGVQRKAQDAAGAIADWAGDSWAWLKDWAGDGRSVAASRDGESLWRTAPPSLADLWAYTRTGGWMPGDQNVWLERAGKVYGALVIAVAALVYAGLFVIARPPRVLLLLATLAVLAIVNHHQ
jgi:hypothetical protein